MSTSLTLRLTVSIATNLLLSSSALAATELSYDRVIADSLKNSYDIRLAKIDTKLARNQIKQARVAYFPTVSLQGNIEHLKALTNQNQQPVGIGQTFLQSGTRYQEALYLTTTYTLFDFGQRLHSLRAAKRGYEASTFAVRQKARDLKVEVIDVYAKALCVYKEQEIRQQELAINEELIVAKQRLFEAGTLRKTDIVDQIVKADKIRDEITELKQQLSDHLSQLTLYTKQLYDVESISMLDMPVNKNDPFVLNREGTPDFQYYQKQIESKTEEIKALKRNYLPKIGVYNYYSWYGQNQSSLGKALDNFTQRSVTVGFSMNYNLFDGLKNQTDIEKAKLEIERLKTEQEQKLWQLENRRKTLVEDASLYDIQLSTKAKLVSGSKTGEGLYKRLTDRQVLDRTILLTKQAENLDHQIQLIKASIWKQASLLKLISITTG